MNPVASCWISDCLHSETYEKAHNKFIEAEHTSNLDTEDESNTRRTVKKPARFDTDSYTEDGDEADGNDGF